MKWLIVTTVFFLVFFYGILSCYFQWFPYAQILALKNNLLPAADTANSYQPSSYYLEKKSLFEIHKDDRFDVFFIGDSLTDNGSWQEFFPDFKIANRGIQGDTIKGVLERVDGIPTDPQAKIFLMIGINDLLRGRSVDEVFPDYQRLAQKLSDKSVHLYLQSCLLVGHSRAALNAEVAQLNARLKRLSASLNSVSFIDLNVHLSEGSVLKSEYTIDDVHLNGQGYLAWYKVVQGYLQAEPLQ